MRYPHDFTKADYFEKQDIAQKRIAEFLDDMEVDDEDIARAFTIGLLEDLGIELDGCSSCGAMPMETNCNNARCQD